MIYYCDITNIYKMDVLLKLAQSTTLPKPTNSQPSTDQLSASKQQSTFDLSKDQGLKRLFSSILLNVDDNDHSTIDPQLIRNKNNLLLFLLILSAYGVYYLIGEFLNVLLIAYIAGIAYKQSRYRFTNFITSSSTYEIQPQSWPKRMVKVLFWAAIAFIFPRLRYLFTHPHKFTSLPSLNDYFRSIQKTNSYVVLVCQIFIGLYIVHLLIGEYLRKIGKKIRPTNENFVQGLFAVLTMLLIIGLVIVVPTIFVKEVTNAGYIIEQRIESELGCEIITFKDGDNSSLPLCTQKFQSQNQFIRQTMIQFRQQNQTLEECLVFLEKVVEDYLEEYLNRFDSLSKNVYYYQQILCTWYSFITKAITYSGITISTKTEDLQTVVLKTGSSLFKVFFGNLTWILSMLSNSVFNMTTFVTTFLLTIKVGTKNSTFKQLFSASKNELISSITDLIQATFFIVFWHFILSLLLLEIFKITPINLIVSTLLASMALFPFFRPWLGVFIITLIRILIIQEYYISLSFVVVYYLLSQKIYSVHYRKMELHQIITNMSVLFGIYKFGIVGVVYGPLIIIIFQFVQRELFKRYRTRKPTQDREKQKQNQIQREKERETQREKEREKERERQMQVEMQIEREKQREKEKQQEKVLEKQIERDFVIVK